MEYYALFKNIRSRRKRCRHFQNSQRLRGLKCLALIHFCLLRQQLVTARKIYVRTFSFEKRVVFGFPNLAKPYVFKPLNINPVFSQQVSSGDPSKNLF